MASTRLPLFESIAAVLAIGVVAALTALPTRSGRTDQSAKLVDRIGLIRTAIFRFSMEHYDDSGKILPGRNGEDLVLQLTGRSRHDGSVEPPSSGREDRWKGPYLKSIPANPVSGLDTVRIVRGDGIPALLGEAGWVYQPETGKLWPDLPGTDPRGIPYTEY